jgi:hypothetical protein
MLILCLSSIFVEAADSVRHSKTTSLFEEI